MSFFKELHRIIPIELSDELDDFSLSIKKENKGRNKHLPYRINKSRKEVIIFLDNLSWKENKDLKKVILKYFRNNEVKFIEQSKVDLIKRLIDFNHGDSVKILNFFKDILNNTDYNALRDSLFLREEYKRGNSIGYLKSEILSNYGQRGNIISNLCSAGYFEEVMMPLYNEDKTKFYEFYDLAVDRGVKALFVNHNMTVNKIINEIKHRIKSAKNSGLKNINIHGIGSINVKNIKKVWKN